MHYLKKRKPISSSLITIEGKDGKEKKEQQQNTEKRKNPAILDAIQDNSIYFFEPHQLRDCNNNNNNNNNNSYVISQMNYRNSGDLIKYIVILTALAEFASEEKQMIQA